MKLGNDIIKNKFDDIDIKVDFLIELCQTLQVENLELSSSVKDLEKKLAKKNEIEELVTFIQPEEMKRAEEMMSSKSIQERALPSKER